MLPQPSPEAAPAADPQTTPDAAPAQDMVVIQVPNAMLTMLAQALTEFTPIIIQAAQKASSDIEAQKGGPGQLAPGQDEGAPSADNDVGFNSQLASELDGMRKGKR